MHAALNVCCKDYCRCGSAGTFPFRREPTSQRHQFPSQTFLCDHCQQSVAHKPACHAGVRHSNPSEWTEYSDAAPAAQLRWSVIYMWCVIMSSLRVKFSLLYSSGEILPPPRRRLDMDIACSPPKYPQSARFNRLAKACCSTAASPICERERGSWAQINRSLHLLSLSQIFGTALNLHRDLPQLRNHEGQRCRFC